MKHLRTVGARLSLALLLVVAIALALVYLIVVPTLRTRLIDSKLAHLRGVAPSVVTEYRANPLNIDFADAAALRSNARVAVVNLFSDSPPTLTVEADSQYRSTDIQNDRLALQALETQRYQEGTLARDDEQYAEVAAPVPGTTEAILLSTPLHDALADVHLVQRRLLLAGALALLVALLIGYGAASIFARRIRRLERAADRIAGGEFETPVVDPTADELGELARTFDRMRVRLSRLDHARREFVANASHELRTPLFSLGGFLELLTDEELDEATRQEFFATMSEQVGRLTKLAEDLLDLSRLDAGRLRVEPQPVELNEIAETAVEEFAGIAKASRHPLELETNGPVTAVADEQRVLQIARILVENALVHTDPETPVRVRVATKNGPALLSVEDEGAGIPSEHASQLFERFYRAHGTRASGSGLGLAIARELAELMGGRIELESGRGRTVFSLVLPVR
jgi:signal transduction histidine kinase